MILVIGGTFQGKGTYAKENFKIDAPWIDGENCTFDDIFSCGAIEHFHRFVYRFLDREELGELPEKLAEENPEILIISDELGYGVVPVDAKDRFWREKTGRICTSLAAHAAEVHRVVCGIGMVIKNA
ncbi:bifunctional adenosylcobinamide kinase/adenosylcobinamide-phosphate guanylyltransferase [Novisyntrophococcus fermenticellae]|uniref:bifunctional adenosylcobinamide kinase/adenosylcobinamide-phosphate guanylyltransferase n=1 Tax=Novisyntrophococcus fermenticellae TaxID=2068655 RepID=UPI001E503F9D|nr:bifunctional adenosylcobinamide kinase/adenosylcobinamide-phosphate guanylyltransferase [Novisyntrophococcus fermenticellae]